MSAETLRRAAALMRERAEAAVVSLPDTVPDWHSVGSLMGSGKTLGDAEHIASWHPAVALAVADWLEDVARIQESIESGIYWNSNSAWHSSKHCALAVATAYLGSDA